jgi:hypothetical protein
MDDDLRFLRSSVMWHEEVIWLLPLLMFCLILPCLSDEMSCSAVLSRCCRRTAWHSQAGPRPHLLLGVENEILRGHLALPLRRSMVMHLRLQVTSSA